VQALFFGLHEKFKKARAPLINAVMAAAFRKITVQGATLGQVFAPAKPAFPPSVVVTAGHVEK
jgi:hypothetical protein